jgi:hypothetical protein
MEFVFCCVPRYAYLLYEAFLSFHDEVARATSTEHISVSNADFLSRHFLVYEEFKFFDEDYLQRVVFVRTVLEHFERSEGPFESGSVLSDILINLSNLQSLASSRINVWRDGYHIFARHAPRSFENWTVDITRGGKITVSHHTPASITLYDQVPFPVPSEVSSTDPKVEVVFPIEGPASFRTSGTTFALERFLVALCRFNQTSS